MAVKKKKAKRTGARIRKRVPANRVPANKGRRYPAEPLTENEVRGLIRACSSTAPTGIRNAALICMLYRCGLRISEALSLLPKDVDAENYSVRILNGKGGKDRVVGITMACLSILQRWMDIRRQRRIPNTVPIFCTLKHKAISADYVRALLPRLAAKAGIEKRVHAHGLRHTLAAQLMSEGKPLNVIQQVLGHSDLGTTSRYLQHIHPQQVIDAMRDRVIDRLR